MFNRLLNFVETKKTVRLSAHNLAAVEDRLQSGARMHLHNLWALHRYTLPKPPTSADVASRESTLVEGSAATWSSADSTSSVVVSWRGRRLE